MWAQSSLTLSLVIVNGLQPDLIPFQTESGLTAACSQGCISNSVLLCNKTIHS